MRRSGGETLLESHHESALLLLVEAQVVEEEVDPPEREPPPSVGPLRGRDSAVASRLALIHCVTSYPVPPAEANLRSIPFLLERHPELVIGYSDHTIGIDAVPLAVALGARVIEKHFTLDRAFSDFRDHQLSADPPLMKELVARVRIAELLLGRKEKRIQGCEAALVPEVRRAAVAARDLGVGERLRAEDVLWLRPTGPVTPGKERALLGKRLLRRVPRGEPLAPEVLE